MGGQLQLAALVPTIIIFQNYRPDGKLLRPSAGSTELEEHKGTPAVE